MPLKESKPTGLCERLRVHLSYSQTTYASYLVLALCLIIPTPKAIAAVPQDWSKTPYAHETALKALPVFLEDFARTVGLQLHIDGDVQGTVQGKLRADTLLALLDRLALEHGFQWFVYNNTLYISTLNQQTSERIEVAENTATDLKLALTQIGLLDNRFGWGELPEIGVVLVSGPKRYVEHIKLFSRKRAGPYEKQNVLSFPLKFANAADRHIDYRGQTLTVPGVASILRELFNTQSKTSPNLESLLPNRLSNTNTAAQSENSTWRMPGSPIQSNLPLVPHSPLPSGRNHNVRVEADVRNNSVLIYDSEQRNALYQSLITKLDVARKLVEIDAIILDINRTQLNALGANWGFQNSRFQAGINNLSPGAASTLSIRNMRRFTADIKALEERGLATVVSNPSIMTLENQPAVIDFNRTQYIKAVGDGVANILPVTVGTSFQVVPRVINANSTHQVHLIIDIEDGNFSEPSGENSSPDVRKGKVSTQAVISEQQSLVIGGFHVAEDVDSLNRVPLLWRIPFIGKALFTSSESAQNRRERLFILTPRLIGDQINPSRYLPQSDQAHLEAALTPLARRNAPHPSVITRTDIANTLAELVRGRVPEPLKARPMPANTNLLCRIPDPLKVEPGKSQWYEGPGYNIAVLVLHNQGEHRIRLDESECSSEHTLAVSVWPQVWLAPGEKAEVFIANRTLDNTQQQAIPRSSLITPARMTSQ
ncbi:type III secretion system outer membrane ring subunit SctC [Pseudomonas sp.]|uniref:type III secretion system outer membrane ring subunit SctC n=1 Tax=Pseudomonas sp. TaxID=306 RepID=UPI002623F461|nr:type III secretion system outer membrane ring subunit SctC [Pseudomonas sp.]